MIKLLCGGSPCTYWSIAQTKNRETEASGLGWELFLNYRIARDKYQPDYFLYENNKSMAKAIRDKITEELGVEPVLINSALVSAQNRQRLYWVGKRNPDGTYSQVDIEQPEDRGILLRDILETGVPWREKSYTLDANYWKTAGVYNPEKQHSNTRHMAAEPVGTTQCGKSYCLTSGYSNGSGERIGNYAAHTLLKGCKSMVAEAVCVAQRGRNPDNPKSREVGLPTEQMLEARADYKTNTLTTVQKDNMVAEPLCTTVDGKSFNLTTSCQKAIPEDTLNRHRHTMVCEPVNITEDGKSQCLRATCYKDGIRNMVGNDVDRKTCVAEPVCMRYERTDEAKRLRKQYEAHEIHHGYHEYHELHPREDGKSNTLSTVLKDNQICEPVRVGTIESTAKNADFDSQQYRVYSPDGKAVTLCGQGGGVGAKTGLYATPITEAEPMRVPEATKKGYCDIQPGDCVDLAQENSKTRRGRSMTTKSNCMTTSCEFYEYCGTLDKPIYTVKNGIITIKDKQYPIKLRDGCYIIRKLTVTECCRLQTVPEWYFVPHYLRIGGVYLRCENVPSMVVKIPYQVKKQGCVINTTFDLHDMELQNSLGNLLTTAKSASWMDVIEINKQQWDTVLCTIRDIEELGMCDFLTDATTMLKVMMNTGLSIEKLLKKCLEESSNKEKLFITLTLIKEITTQVTSMYAGTKTTHAFTDYCVGSYLGISQTSLTLATSFSTEKNISLVSNSACYKMLGNGWTCDVIAHIMSRFDGITTEPIEVLSMYDGMSCGHIALDKLGAGVTKYYATEIDKYAIKTTQHNYPDTIQLGDAFQVRDWPERWNGQKEEDTQ